MGCFSSRALPLTADEEAALQAWDKLGGSEFESVLESGAIELLDSQYLVALAGAGGLLAPRQTLMPNAFVWPEDLKMSTSSVLKIVCLSYMWLQADHPDPHGHSLRIMARALELIVADDGAWGGKWSVFLDFCSLYQNCRDHDGEPQQRVYSWLAESGCFAERAVGRFDQEEDMFNEAFGNLGSLYSHPGTIVFMLTKLPPDFDNPNAYKQTGNRGQFFERGWCFCEAHGAMLVKHFKKVLDLGRDTGDARSYSALVRDCARGRKPPLLPSRFATEIVGKEFGDAVGDCLRVTDLYEVAFYKRFGTVTVLDYAELGWGDNEVEAVAQVLGSGAVPCLRELYLNNNAVRSRGARALMEALATARAVELKMMGLSNNAIEDAGVEAVAEFLMKDGAPDLRMLLLAGNGVCDHGVMVLAGVLVEGKAPQLRHLSLAGNSFGDRGADAVAQAIPELPELVRLQLGENSIGPWGLEALKTAWGARGTELGHRLSLPGKMESLKELKQDLPQGVESFTSDTAV